MPCSRATARTSSAERPWHAHTPLLPVGALCRLAHLVRVRGQVRVRVGVRVGVRVRVRIKIRVRACSAGSPTD